MKVVLKLVKGFYVTSSVHTCVHRVRHAPSHAALKGAVLTWAARIQMAPCLVCVGVTDAPLGASVIGPEGLVAAVMVTVVSAATLGQGDTGVAIQHEPRVTLAGLHTSQGAGPRTEWVLTGGGAGCATGLIMAIQWTGHG